MPDSRLISRDQSDFSSNNAAVYNYLNLKDNADFNSQIDFNKGDKYI